MIVTTTKDALAARQMLAAVPMYIRDIRDAVHGVPPSGNTFDNNNKCCFW
jgi:hypothetical protein